MFSIHQQTIRLYEKEGLICPKRSEGNTRLFSEEDLDRLEQIIHLTHQLGVNLAGVQMVLKMQKKMEKMQKKMNTLFENTQKELKLEQKTSEEALKTGAKALIRMRQESDCKNKEGDETTEIFDIDSWEVDYEE